MYDYDAANPDEISIREGDEISIMEPDGKSVTAVKIIS
jgi:hypothetical protein